ncbi:uncharacterized protein LOC132840233 [Tachysurus vachellii]|uniref:uncharacterized protein LOC132840233 n=1 Tax=Tachysurus vachellii TaxID=175792 RepID=UPI00296AA946|nr:uncharacterized protein LOC132840233 [Tachysurus vachellii]XP_060717727.1 uncharacterized protein LOC132840233 [Tachysurus vachellii]XP_060717728.1 uncharacterized protein LOC132840233 [Tachysurus vachellii]XP_060717729.1 uncharacterized protein LOC132840233 [Tachysurus vachellii]XP_060717730.1 uncharacterized protein LOC132840233 [Tachysurus vachellii]
MASHPHSGPDLRPGHGQSVKDLLLGSQQLLVASLYNLAPLLDCVLAAGLLSLDNYHEVKAEKTPKNRARKLLEIVQGQMDENGALCFLECLRECKQHYPRLRSWLAAETEIQRGPTERKLQAQFSCLCSRLGFSVLPVSLALFSNSVLTQFDLERIQAAPTPTEQSHVLLTICLTKGEMACKSFYTALYSEDPQLSEDINIKESYAVSSLLKDLSLNSKEVSSIGVAVEETRDTAAGHLPYSEVLQQVRAQLGVAVGDEARLNVCKLGVAVGLPRHIVKECLLEGVSLEDSAQLEALVALFMEKTQDAERLLSRVAELEFGSVQLSERGCLSLKLLQEADALLRRGSHSHNHTWDYQLDQGHLDGADCDDCTLWTIFRYLVWDCLVEAVEEPKLKASGGLATMLQQLHGCALVDLALLQELEQCWSEGGAENLLQSIRVLAQILRDLHSLHTGINLSSPVEGLYSCWSRLHRVTSFQGVSARAIRKVLNSVVPASTQQDSTPRARHYREVCVYVARLLDTMQAERSIRDFANSSIAQITQHIRLVLSGPAFNSQTFDAGIWNRLMCLTEFNPAQLGLGLLMQLHQETLSDLKHYLQPGECHSSHFVLESVRMFGSPRLISVNSTRGPVTIDDGVEVDLYFKISKPASFMVRLHCRGYEKSKGHFEVHKPSCVHISQLREEGTRAINCLGSEVLAQENDEMWIRESGSGWWEELQCIARRYSVQLQEQGCCFMIITSESECLVKFIYRRGRLWATAQRGCEVI